MKKIIALLIAALMIFTLVACNNDAKPENSGSGGGGQATEQSPAPAPAASGGTGNSPAPAPAPDGGGNVIGSAPVENAGSPSAAENAIGFFTDGVDPASRKTYNIVWAYMRPMQLFLNITDAMKELEPILNVKITDYCANSDIDALLQNLEIYASQGVDGFIIVIDYTANMRIKEVLDGTGLPYIGILNSVRDPNTHSNLVPLVGMDGFPMGEMMVQWLYDHYKEYWGDIDTSKIGLLNFTCSPGVDFHDRYRGNQSKFEQLLPGNVTFEADGVVGALNEQTGYDLASAIFAAHPEVEYWWVPTCLELYGLGALRAAEALNIDDKVLLTTVNSDVLTGLWNSGEESGYVSCIATAALQYAAPSLCGVVAMIDGKETPETLWAHRRAPGDATTFYDMTIEFVTIDTYKAFFEWVRKESGL